MLKNLRYKYGERKQQTMNFDYLLSLLKKSKRHWLKVDNDKCIHTVQILREVISSPSRLRQNENSPHG